ncbi:MAG: DUF1080 domain-containing protein [Puniceicoccales bacterium]|jgi:hypothetical protein|nr:DUF1080 domain-containing protein [Puniceicoccales bacterium]
MSIPLLFLSRSGKAAAAAFALAALAAAPAHAADAPAAAAVSAVKSCCGTVAAEVAADAYPAPDSGNKPPAGFVALFNGQNLDGWWGAGNDKDPRQYLALPADAFKKKHDDSLAEIRKHWSVQGGELVNDGRGLFLTTDKTYGDFEFLVDYKTWPRADSGVYLRGIPQVQIWDYTEKGKFGLGADKGSGGLWNNAGEGKHPLVKADRPFGEWNRLRVVMTGSRVWVWLNGKQTVKGAVLDNYFNRRIAVPALGPILLQTHGKEIRWRNIFVREIGAAEASRILARRDADGFAQIFNGKDLAGWKGATDAVEIKDGVIHWKRRKGGTLFTEKEYADFKLRFEFKLPKGANNGIAIRYPGRGDTAYTGMTELQILDDNYEKNTGSKIDPRQAHGSVYGIAAAQRGYQRPLGEWNFQEVTVVGSKIKVELNGYVILDTDVSKVKTYMHNSPHPGKDRKSGHLGFAGHNDPVEFRNVSVKEL